MSSDTDSSIFLDILQYSSIHFDPRSDSPEYSPLFSLTHSKYPNLSILSIFI